MILLVLQLLNVVQLPNVLQLLILVLQLLNVVQLLNLLHLLNVVFVVWPSAPIFWLPVFLLPFRHVVLVVLEVL